MKRLILSLILVFLFLNLVSAEQTFKQYDDIRITHPVRVDGVPGTDIICNITVQDPDHVILAEYRPMYNNATLQQHEYTIFGTANTSQPGEYCYDITCFSSTINKTSSYCIDVTPTGRQQTSLLDNPFLLIFVGMGLILLVLAIYMSNPTIGFISSIIFVISGIYTMIYGFNNVTDVYSRTIAIVLIGMGLIFMFTSAFEFVWGNKEDE